MHLRLYLILALAVIARPSLAQTPITRADAIRTALERGARGAVSAADTAVANAALVTARARPNPTLNASYSKSLPTHHVSLDIPLEFPMLRNLRIQAAQLGIQAAQLKYKFDRAMIAMDADTTYTHALAAQGHVALSRRNALDADSLLHMVERRRDAGDASDMDVELARVNAGQQTNLAADDSLTMVSRELDLQAVLGIIGEQLEIRPSDSLTAPPEATSAAATTLNEQSAAAALEAAKLGVQQQRRSIWSQFSVSLGFEQGDPSQPGLLPTFGVGLGLPIFDRNRGPIAQAEAERLKAQMELTLAQVEARNELAHALRERQNAIAKVNRDRALVTSAQRVTAMALTAYREGASSLPNVLDAQRTAREVLGQYIDDLAAAWVATAELRVFSLTSTSSIP